MAAAADAPNDGGGSGWDRAFVTPETGSAFDDGHRPLADFFRCTQFSRSAWILSSAFRATALACAPLLDIVEVDVDEDVEAAEDIDDEELDLSGTFLGMNIRVTSSALIEVNPPCALSPVFHPNRGSG